MSVDYYAYLQSAEWRERANAAKRRAGNRCQVCNRPGSAVTLEAHHRTYERLGKERSEDLTVLCRDCHALYEANKRIPQPPPPVQLPTREDIITSIQSPEPLVPPGKQPLLFVPVKSSKPSTTIPAQPAAASLAYEVDRIYHLLPAPSTAQTLPASKAVPSAAARRAQATRDSRIRITAILIVLAMLAAISLLDNGRQASPSTGELRLAATPIGQPTVNRTAAAGATVISTAVPTAAPMTTPTPVAAPLTVVPIGVPPTTAAPLATATISATLAAVPPPADAAQGIVNQTALVCQNPCSCAPVVRTIPSGTQVSILETQRCGLDTWIRIGDAEWLGPRFIEEIPTPQN